MGLTIRPRSGDHVAEEWRWRSLNGFRRTEKYTAPPPLVIRQANRGTLEIETYIDLNAPKLTDRFAPDQGMPKQPVAQPAKKPAKAPTAEWTEKDAEWDVESWDV
ncbi:hypothetical protein B0H19DRAFT_1071060 [Mycena capillaripes]|nr:hypothetical protein B0H19DRAFT_1071060 [Mycena capillaripes]